MKGKFLSTLNAYNEKANYLLKLREIKRSNSCLNIDKNKAVKYSYLLEDDCLSKAKIEKI
jgi:hypothetical protein